MNNILSCLFIVTWTMAFGQDNKNQTLFERSGGSETPRYGETIEYFKNLAAASSWITFTTFGKSSQGRDLPLVILDKDGLKSPAEIRMAGKLILLIQACIHAGESEGKDAGMMLFRDIAMDHKYTGVLDHVSVIFIPIFNVDGHERFGLYNRINQNGPKEMGWRVTATNLNLNRDYLKADTPEMQAWLRMFNDWSPDFFIDSHTTDGADYQYVLTYLIEIYGTMGKELTGWSKQVFIPLMEKQMSDKGILVFPYVTFRNWTNLKSGLIIDPAPPMLSQGYTSLRNRPGLLIETHMLKPYKERVEATYECMLTVLKILDREYATLKHLIAESDAETSSHAFRQQPFPLQFRTLENDSVMTDFKGKEYETVKSDITGQFYNRYMDKPVNYRIPSFTNNQPSVTVRLPEAYIIPAEWKTVIDRLALHGVKMIRLKKDESLTVITYKIKNPIWQSNPFEGRHPIINFETEEIREEQTFPAQSVLVPMDQPAAKIIAHCLEPKGNGSFLYWGFFDAIFEQKEYSESYVIEPLIARMIAENPTLKSEFNKKMAGDTAFAKSPSQIINWFYMNTPYFDQRKNIYPVGKIYDDAIINNLLKDQ
jgi:hypothetical protein